MGYLFALIEGFHKSMGEPDDLTYICVVLMFIAAFLQAITFGISSRHDPLSNCIANPPPELRAFCKDATHRVKSGTYKPHQ